MPFVSMVDHCARSVVQVREPLSLHGSFCKAQRSTLLLPVLRYLYFDIYQIVFEKPKKDRPFNLLLQGLATEDPARTMAASVAAREVLATALSANDPAIASKFRARTYRVTTDCRTCSHISKRMMYQQCHGSQMFQEQLS